MTKVDTKVEVRLVKDGHEVTRSFHAPKNAVQHLERKVARGESIEGYQIQTREVVVVSTDWEVFGA